MIQSKKMTGQIHNKTLELDGSQLQKMLLYNNEDVISRFTDMFAVDTQEAEDLFSETKKFLFICQLKGVFIPDDLLILDEMWHNFILFTRVYHTFCHEHFGRYFHHLPASKKEKEEQQQKNRLDPEAARTEYLAGLRHVIQITYDHLGEETVIKWFKIYPVKYSKDIIKSLRKT